MWSFRTVFGSTLEADTTMCGSRCAAGVEANAIARRALLPSPLRCRGRAACGSGADLCVALFPLSHLLLRRSFRLCEWRLPGWPGDDERAALRAERVASMRACVSARAGVARDRAAFAACCRRCAWCQAVSSERVIACAPVRSRCCAVCRVRLSSCRARSRDKRSRIGAHHGRRGAATGARAGAVCRLVSC